VRTSARWVWQSISPGNTVFVERSRIFALLESSAATDRLNLLPAQQDNLLSSTRPFSTSITRPALIAVTPSGGVRLAAPSRKDKKKNDSDQKEKSDFTIALFQLLNKRPPILHRLHDSADRARAS